MGIGVLRLDRNCRAERRGRPIQVALVPVDDAHRVMCFGAWFDRERALELGERLRQSIGATENEREVVARQRVARCQFERPAKADNRTVDVLLRLRQSQREVPIRIRW